VLARPGAPSGAAPRGLVIGAAGTDTADPAYSVSSSSSRAVGSPARR
jgi:hypothetical protein